jgi:hypothetical protein
MKRLTAILLVIAAGACGAPAKKSAVPEGVSPEKAARLLAQADEARKGSDFDKARQLLTEASEAAAAHQRHDVDTFTELLNKTQSRAIEDDIATQIEDGQCGDAIAYTAMHASKSERLGAAIRERADKPLTGCITKRLDKDDIAGAYTLVSSKEAEQALSKHALAKLRRAIRRAMAARVKDTIGEAFSAHDYDRVMTGLAKLVAKGEATAAIQAKVVENVRSAIEEDIATIYSASAGQSEGAAKALANVDTLIAIGWPKDGKQTPPKELEEKRQHLRFLIGCQTIGCNSVEVAQRWTYGDAGLFALKAPQSDTPAATLRSGTRLWQLASGKGRTLVATEDPGTPEDLIARASKSAGWMDTAMLKAQDTSEWLPPGDSLLKTRVWAPLRKGEKYYELGYVTAIDGAQVTVRRLSDRQEVSLLRLQVHFGIVKADTKVMAYCRVVDKLEPALIASVKETHFEQQGDPLVTLRCLNDDGTISGQNKEGQLASVRMKPAWLPPRR